MTPTNPIASGTAGDSSALASGKHQGLRQPADDQRVEDALDNIGLEDCGELMEDHLRDRHSKGVRGGYDDSIDHDAIDLDAAGQAASASDVDRQEQTRQGAARSAKSST
jgi:hypothetical protein